MLTECDVALIGTGLAPLVAAANLIASGKTVLILNPDRDFFREESELPLDPFWPQQDRVLNAQRLSAHQHESVLEALRPDYPGPVEYCAMANKLSGYHDEQAPHVRSRSRIWMEGESEAWEQLEALYVEAADAGLNPRLLEESQAARHFPGFSPKMVNGKRGLLLSDLCDVDVDPYRSGLLEFLRERLGEEGIVCPADPIEITADGVRYYSAKEQKSWQKTRLHQGLMVFLTPRLLQWLQTHIEETVALPSIQMWEEWTLVSRDALDPRYVGMLESMTVWAQCRGPLAPTHRLNVLKPGLEIPPTYAELLKAQTWASGEHLSALARLCKDFLKWDKVSVRAMKPRILFSPAKQGWVKLKNTSLTTYLVHRSDGPLVDIVKGARTAAGEWE